MLCFRPDGSFTIVQFTDLHWRDGDELDLRTRALMDRVLDAERPDLVVFTGDVIDGAACSDPARSWREAMATVENRDVPWAAVFGNHDDEGSLNREELMHVQQQCKGCLSERGPSDLPGIGNYMLKVAGSGRDSLAATFYFLDSGGTLPGADGEYAWITPQQIDWYSCVARDLRKLGPTSGAARDPSAPALMFFHIPIPEYEEFCQRYGWTGNKLENVCCPKFNSGLFSALAHGGDVVGVFVGHDHLNDFEVTRDGVRLCYGRCTGYGGYGRDDFPRGARVIRLREGECRFDTWVRVDSTQ